MKNKYVEVSLKKKSTPHKRKRNQFKSQAFSSSYRSRSTPAAKPQETTTANSSTTGLEGSHIGIHPSASSKIKRIVDIVGALVGLTITALLAIPIALAIQLDNPGPLFYSQVRCGLKGKHFRIWKFRSMVVNADKQKHLVANQAEGHIFKNENDPRVTTVGRFLRRTSLDEFPQFWNVLRGDMSLVGTRPPTPDEVVNYDEHHWQRLQVKPGITGLWQVNGRSSVLDFEEIVKMDLDYQHKWSRLYDLSLIVQTIVVVLARKGAY